MAITVSSLYSGAALAAEVPEPVSASVAEKEAAQTAGDKAEKETEKQAEEQGESIEMTELPEETAEITEVPEDGTYTIEVAMEGGSGRATIQSPCELEVKDGKMTATIIWSSEKYDYMIVGEEHIDPVRTEGGSTFLIPVEALDKPLTVIGDTTAMSTPHEIEYTLTFNSASLQPADKKDGETASLEDGVYTATFTTDSSMFHINEALEGKGTLTVRDGKMTIHITLVSKSIVNLFPGLAEDAQKEGAELLEPTIDSVTYSDGYTEEVYGFDVPVPAIDEEFDLALIGKKGVWYDHKVSVTDPQPVDEDADAAE